MNGEETRLRLTSLKLPASGFLSFLVAACALQPLPSRAERPTTAAPATPVAERGVYLVPVDARAAPAQAKTLPQDDSGAGLGKDAAHRSDFGVRALQRARHSYAAGDVTAARRSLVEATAVLANTAVSMEAPGRGETWVLVNDLRRLRLVEGGMSAVTLHGLDDAESRASALAVQYADGRGAPPTPRE
jgi:hypothetical protein